MKKMRRNNIITKYAIVSNDYTKEYVGNGRNFNIDMNMENGIWGFRYVEQSTNPSFYEFYFGVITDGTRFLFYRLDDDNIMSVYASIVEMYEGGETECEFYDTNANEQILLDALNALPADSLDYCGEGCPLRTIRFHENGED